jgi:hypothetical protein
MLRASPLCASHNVNPAAEDTVGESPCGRRTTSCRATALSEPTSSTTANSRGRVSGGRAPMVAAVLGLFLFAPSAATAPPADEVVVVEDDPVVDEGGVVRFRPTAAETPPPPGVDDTAAAPATDAAEPADDTGDEPIILVDDPATPLPVAPQVTGPLGRLWETWHVAADSDFLGSVQLAAPEDGPWRWQAGLFLESWLLPQSNLSFFGTAIARTGMDGTTAVHPWIYLDLYELYARIRVDRSTVSLGRLVVPWGKTLGTAFGDRLQPPDLRRGGLFPDPARQKQPQLGIQLRGALDVVSVEAVAFVSYDKSEGSLAAVNQGGVRLGRYQTALVRAPSAAYGLLRQEDTSRLRLPASLGQPTLALRAGRRVGDVDVTGSVAWQLDETPTLTLSPEVALALGAEALALRGRPIAPGLATPCGGETSLSCVGTRGALDYARTTTLAMDASWGLGVVVVRAEAVVWPRVAGQGGKTALIVDDDGLRSIPVELWQTAVAVEGQLGPAVDGSLELFNVSWDGVPQEARLWGIEVLRADASNDDDVKRRVQRLALGGVLGGELFGERVRWRLRGEAGILQSDLLVSGEVRYRLPVLDLYLGGRGDVFTGLPGTPGWMRQDASLLGVFVGEGA